MPPSNKGHVIKQFSCEVRLQRAECTSVLIGQLPKFLTRDKLLSILDSEGLQDSYDFVHVPFAVIKRRGVARASRRRNCGVAFVNFNLLMAPQPLLSFSMPFMMLLRTHIFVQHAEVRA